MATLEARAEVRADTASARLARFAARTPLHFVLIGVAVLWIVPTLGLLITSFRHRPDISATGWWHAIFHWHWTLHNYGLVLHAQNLHIGKAWVNSLIITVPATLLPLIIGALAAYGFAWVPFPFRDTIFLVVIALMIIPIQTSLVPLLKLFREWHLSVPHFGITQFGFIGIWLAHTAFGLPLAIYLLRNYIGSLPSSIIESARIDGADHFTIFWRLIVPLSVPALAAFAIFQFMWVWNDLLVAYVFLGGSQQNRVLTVALRGLVGATRENWQLLTAAAFVSMSLPLVVFFSLQRYFIRGLTAGSVKG